MRRTPTLLALLMLSALLLVNDVLSLPKDSVDFDVTWNESWYKFSNAGLPVTCLSGNASGSMLAGAGSSPFASYYSIDTGDSWYLNTPGFSDGVASSLIRPDGSIFCAPATSSYYLQMSADNGNSWTTWQDHIPARDVMIDDRQNIYVCGWWGSDGRWTGMGGILKSTDLGSTWIGFPVPSPASAFAVPRMHASSRGTLAALVTWHDYQFSHYMTYISTDSGLSWFASSPGGDGTVPNDYVSTGNGYLYAATGLGVFRTTDGGQNWDPTNNGLPASDIYSMTVNSSDVLFAGSVSGGVFRSTDYGYSWKPINAGLIDKAITSLYCNADGILFAGTSHGRIFNTNSSSSSKKLPAASDLLQNYPNPCNSGTTIDYVVGGVWGQGSGVSDVRLTVYDLLGREVAVLVHDVKSYGSYQVQFDGSGLASGLYTYRLTAGGFVQTRKLLLLH